ncbi:hypothetical protein CAR_50p200 (plasmid) [Carnobacterium sp. 17-4]|uniref:addiction module toxin YoeB n=1 Tax=Carnobacterium sp. (strain 17-4) TaxID=208596 RepID=UPI000205848E|nr:addiction module toxin YoeB [Carnobacterium sp. 17-4]AEB31192.1 hypothetical protein CAR_50p200 [Carnobacterium sp. 17-4]
MTDTYWKILQHRDIKEKHIPLLERDGLKGDFNNIIKIPQKKPFEQVRLNEVFQLKNKKVQSMRINDKHRVIFTIAKATRTVTIWAAWSHNEENLFT